jgi:hypothetical protein
LLKGSKLRVQPEPQQEPRDAPAQQQQQGAKINRNSSVQHKLKLEFEGLETSAVTTALDPRLQNKRHHRRRRQQLQREQDGPAASPRARSPAATHRQQIIDSLLSLAMASIKQPQPSLPLSTVVHGGPCGFRSPRRQVRACTKACLCFSSETSDLERVV